jgi:hypothetical protein
MAGEDRPVANLRFVADALAVGRPEPAIPFVAKHSSTSATGEHSFVAEAQARCAADRE